MDLRKVLSHYRDQADRGEVARGGREEGGRAPQYLALLAERGLDGIEGHRPDHEKFQHGGPYTPFLSWADGPSRSDSRLRVAAGIWWRGVSTAVSSARAQEHGRSPVRAGATVWMICRDRATLRCRVSMMASTVTASCPGCQQSSSVTSGRVA